ncbi:MAG: type II/IV secretion system protein [Chloroflexi bacterium]|nr:type II/IV secretion system protein [Chloroflexota bacterium]
MSTAPIRDSGRVPGPAPAPDTPEAPEPNDGILPAFDWSVLEPGEAATHIVPEFVARRYLAFPARVDGRKLTMVMADPGDYYAIRSIEARSRMEVIPAYGNERDILNAIDVHYSSSMPEAVVEAIDEHYAAPDGIDTDDITAIRDIPLVFEQGADDDGSDDDSPVIHAIDSLIAQASKARATDIHIEPMESRVRVRFRIDGYLQEVVSLPQAAHGALLSRLKIMAGMDIAERRRPQDGHFGVRVGTANIDVRAASTDTVHGEMIVLRILNKSLKLFSLDDLGLDGRGAADLKKMLGAPYGIILVAGPTGAGKTTTLYAALNELDHARLNILTIEDPVEYRFEGVNSMQINEKADLTFASLLRASLRLDPDVILVGEIRDSETARIAIQAALTGHLVLSSVHANDAIRSITRVIDLGVEPFLLSSALLGVVSQRMVRKIDPHCAVKHTPTVEEIAAMGGSDSLKEAEFMQGEGCYFCSFTGYHGRTGLFEVLAASEKFKGLIARSPSHDELADQARADGYRTIREDGVRKARRGVTTPVEVMRSVYTI